MEFSESRIGAEKVVVNHSKENGIVGGVKNLIVASMVYLDTILKSEGDMNMINMAYIIWFFVTIAAVTGGVIIGKVLIASHKYKCTECGMEFNVKWYWGAKLWGHDSKGRDLQCPNCKQITYCRYTDVN